MSSGGGTFPTWSPARPEIFYTPQGDSGTLMTVGYSVVGHSFRPGNPRRWTPVSIRPQAGTRTFDVHPNGKQIMTALPSEAGADEKREVIFVFDFFEKLRQTRTGGAAAR